MAATYISIASTTLSSSAASVTFSSIPQTYTDLVIKGSARSDSAAISDVIMTEFNANTNTIYSNTYLVANSASTLSGTSSGDASARTIYYISAANATSDTFGNFEIYIPSYIASQNKPYSGFGVGETNGTDTRVGVTAMLFRDTTAITSIKLTLLTGPNFVSGSTFHLYGIKNS